MLRVDLDAFAANLAVVRARVAPAQLMLVVKDDAYGHGLEPIVRRRAAEGVRWFGAFDVRPEAIRARGAAGPEARIFSWLTVGRDEIAAALAADIDLGVGDAGFLEEVAAVARAAGAAARVHLKIDTGLHRNGIRPEEWPAVRRARRARSSDEGVIDVVGVWSHIAEASDAEDDDARGAVRRRGDRRRGARDCALEVRHLAASAASFARPEFRYDLVRVGAFCYGIRSAGGPGEADLGIRPIAALAAPVTHVGGDAVHVGDRRRSTGCPRRSPGARHGRARRPAPRDVLRRRTLAISDVEAWPEPRVGDEVMVYGPDGRGRRPRRTSRKRSEPIGEEIAVRVSPLVPRDYRGE